MWPQCSEAGVAAITYYPVENVDLGQYTYPDQVPSWDELAPAQKLSLQRFVWEVRVGDVIYVKQGPMIVGKGVVQGDYQFDQEGQIYCGDESSVVYWRHQRQVRWCPNFRPVHIQVGQPQIVTLVPLNTADVARVKQS
jgi:hypothetical protein